jgi:hypothetical protein
MKFILLLLIPSLILASQTISDPEKISVQVCKNSYIPCSSIETSLNLFRKNPPLVSKKLDENYLNENDEDYYLTQHDKIDQRYEKPAWETYYYQGPENVDDTKKFVAKRPENPSPIKNDATLNLIAKNHAKFLSSRNQITHEGFHGQSALERFSSYGDSTKFKNVGENLMAIRCKNLDKEKKTKEDPLADAEAVILEWILEDGNLIKSNRDNIFHAAPKIFGFYSDKDANSGLCYSVLVLAEKFEINANGRNLLAKDLNTVSSGLDEVNLSGNGGAILAAQEKMNSSNYALLYQLSIAGYIAIIVLMYGVFDEQM